MKGNIYRPLILFSMTFLLISCGGLFKFTWNNKYIPNYVPENQEIISINVGELNSLMYEFHWETPNEMVLLKHLKPGLMREEKYDEMDRTIILNLYEKKVQWIEEDQQNLINDRISENYYSEIEQQKVGGAIVRAVMDTPEDRFKGWVKSSDGSNTINYSGKVKQYKKRSGDSYITEDKIDFHFTCEEQGYKADFTGITGGTIGIMEGISHQILADLGKYLHVSPDGRFIKYKRFLFDIKNGTYEELHDVMKDSVISPDWSKIAFVSNPKKGSMSYDYTTINIEITDFIPSIE